MPHPQIPMMCLRMLLLLLLQHEPDSAGQSVSSSGKHKFASIDTLFENCRSDNPHQRREAYDELLSHIFGCKDLRERNKLVLQLIKGCSDVDLQYVNRKRLLLLPPLYYSPESRYEISRLLYVPGPVKDQLILLCGYLQMEELVPEFRNRLTTGKAIPASEQRALRLALARMNEQDEIRRLIQYSKLQAVDDELVYEFIPFLLYTGQREAYDRVIEIALDTRASCSSPDPSSKIAIPCALHIIELLAPCLQNFPLSPGADGSIQGLSIEEAIRLSKEWLEKNRHTYQLTDFNQIPLSHFGL